MSTYDAIIPAGGTIDPAFAAKAGTDQKALIVFDGETMLETILRALKESGVVRNTVVIGSEQVQEKARPLATHVLDQGSSGPDNIYRGLDKLQESTPDMDKVLIVTCDLPFLSGDLVKRFVNACPEDKDVCIPIILKEDFEKAYPGTSSTFVALKDGTFTLGGMFLMNARKLPEIRPAIQRVFEQRKSKVGMAKMLGPAFVLKWLTKSLTIPDLERKIVSMLGCTGKAVVGAPVELSYDIDYLDDYEYAVKLVGAKA